MQRLTSGAAMRASLFTLVLLLSQSANQRAVAQNNGLESQKQALTRVGQALDRVVVKAKKVTGKLGYGFYEQGCVFGVMLRPGSSATESFALQAGQSYVFIGSGDNTARNVDLVIKDSRGRVAGKDTEADAAPFVLFKPKASGRYTMSLQLKSGWRGSAFCAVTVLRKGGYDLPIERIAQTASKVGLASAAIFSGVNGGRFNQDPNTWALYGAVVRPGRTLSSDPKRYRTANRGIVAVGDNTVRDLDLALLNSQRRSVAIDTKNGAAAGIAHKTNQGTYSIAIANNSSSGPALVMAIILDLPANYSMPASGNSSNTRPQTNSSYAGSWQGEWSDDRNNQNGTFEMRVQRNGSMSGRLYNATVGVACPVNGIVSSNGAIRFNYSYVGVGYLASGTMRFTDRNRDEVEGRVSFSTGGRTFGSGEFYLSKE